MLDWNFIASQIATIAFDIVYFGAIIGTIVVIILDNRNPVKTMAWILILMFLPIVGLVFYFFFGRSQRRVRMIGKKSYSRLLKKPMAEYLAQDSCALPINYSRLISLFRNTNQAFPFDETGWKPIPWGSPCCNPCCANWGKQRSISTWNSISLRTMPLGAWCVMS